MIEQHNTHVLLFYRFMTWLSERKQLSFSQLHYYTLLQKEIDAEWRPEHLR